MNTLGALGLEVLLSSKCTVPLMVKVLSQPAIPDHILDESLDRKSLNNNWHHANCRPLKAF